MGKKCNDLIAEDTILWNIGIRSNLLRNGLNTELYYNLNLNEAQKDI